MNEEALAWLYTDRALALLTVATATCVVYDHITTLDEEIELVWKRRRWTAVQFLFFVNRYLGSAMQLYGAFFILRHIVLSTDILLSTGEMCVHRCASFVPDIGYLWSIVMCSMQGIMIYRVSSMYNHERKIIILLSVAFALETGGLLAIQVLSSPNLKTPVSNQAPASVCSNKSPPTWMSALWILIACFETLLLSLSLVLAIKYHRGIRAIRSSAMDFPSSRRRSPSLAYVLLRDSITFPFISLVICVSSFFVWMYLPNLADQLGFWVAAFVPCIIGPRLILNLREAYYQPFLQECNVSSRLQSGEPPISFSPVETGGMEDDSVHDAM